MQEFGPDWVSLLHFLLRSDATQDLLFQTIRSVSAPGTEDAHSLARNRFAVTCCSNRLAQFGEVDAAAGPEHRIALAYALGWIRVSGGNSVLPPWMHVRAD